MTPRAFTGSVPGRRNMSFPRMNPKEWNELVESQRVRKAGRTPAPISAQPPAPVTPGSAVPGEIGRVLASTVGQALVEHGVFTEAIIERIGELMLAAAEARRAVGRDDDAAAVCRMVDLFYQQGAESIDRRG